MKPESIGIMTSDRGETVVVQEDIIFENTELEIEDFQQLALDPPYVPPTEDAGALCPMCVFKRRVIGILKWPKLSILVV